MIDKNLLPKGIEICAEDLEKTPPRVLELILHLLKRIEELEARLNQDSSNSNRPPSSDSPFKKESSGRVEKKSKAKSRKRRTGHRQQMLDPSERRDIYPKPCSCGCDRFFDLKPYYTHQHIEIPEIVNNVIHFVLYSGKCTECGKGRQGTCPSRVSNRLWPSAFGHHC